MRLASKKISSQNIIERGTRLLGTTNWTIKNITFDKVDETYDFVSKNVEEEDYYDATFLLELRKMLKNTRNRENVRKFRRQKILKMQWKANRGVMN